MEHGGLQNKKGTCEFLNSQVPSHMGN